MSRPGTNFLPYLCLTIRYRTGEQALPKDIARKGQPPKESRPIL